MEVDATIFVTEEDPDEGDLLALERSVTLFRHFENAGVPPEAIKIFSVVDTGQGQARIAMRRMRSS